jgi:thiamine biosynthesis protein ThiS
MAAFDMDDHMITVVVNGGERRLEGSPSVLELLDLLDLDARGVVVELNRQIVRRPDLAQTPLRDGDRVELVHFVGGG